MAAPKIIGWRGEYEFLVDAGRGDSLGMIDAPLGRIFNLVTRKLGDPISVAVLAGRGYWEDVTTIPPDTLAEVETLLDPDSSYNKFLADQTSSR